MRTLVGLALFLSALTLPAQNASAQLAEKKVLTSATAQKMVTAARDFIEIIGGLPITVDGQVTGGIGASFDTPEHDEQIAKAGLAAFTAK